MKKKLSFFLFTFFSVNIIWSQTIKERLPNGGGTYALKPSDEISPAQRMQIISTLQQNTNTLQKKGILPVNNGTQQPQATLFKWPLKQATGFNDPGYYAISNYVDQNPSYPGFVTDYNCGERSYDLPSGYNHKGTDIFSWPFSWDKMNSNAVEIIAAAPGIIIGKEDGNFDQHCSFCPGGCNWNAIYIQHVDGSVAWYGHLKSGSLTSKAMGATVATGEYLGVMGSSGNSTGPHLHFEVYTDNSYAQLVDPWNGACNLLNPGVSWWTSQQPYQVPTLNKIMTSAMPPEISNCPGGEQVNNQSNFSSGSVIYFSSFYRDQLAGQQSIHSIYRPDNSIWQQWSQNFMDNSSAYWSYFIAALPANATTGIWRYQIQYSGSGQTVSVNFGVNTSLPLQLLSFNATKKNDAILLQWKTDKEVNVRDFTIERSGDGNSFNNIQTVAAKNETGQQQYETTDRQLLKSVLYYRLKMADMDGKLTYSPVVNVNNSEGKLILHIYPNPVNDFINIEVNGKADLQLDIHNATGQLIQRTTKNFFTAGNFKLNTIALKEGIYFLTVSEKGQVLERKQLLKTK